VFFVPQLGQVISLPTVTLEEMKGWAQKAQVYFAMGVNGLDVGFQFPYSRFSGENASVEQERPAASSFWTTGF
jgi:hypothetical protein